MQFLSPTTPPPPPKKKKTRVREKITYKLNGQKYKYDISSHKESKFQGSPFPISSNMNSQMVRGLAGCAMSKSKPFLQKSKCDADKLKMTHWQQFLRNISIHANNLYWTTGYAKIIKSLPPSRLSYCKKYIHHEICSLYMRQTKFVCVYVCMLCYPGFSLPTWQLPTESL